jgi:FAD/FMN-containing dehydrogenase
MRPDMGSGREGGAGPRRSRMGQLSRREVLRLSAAAGAGAIAIPGLAAGRSGSGSAALRARARLTGRIVRPGERRYAAARTDWDRLFSSNPRVIVFARRDQDVLNALAWARQNKVALRVRSGRHSLEGWSNVDGGIVIDVSEMKHVEVSPAARSARVGAGLTQAEIVAALGKHGLAVPTGSEGTVGVAGATLGGGFGMLTRSLGMTCDNLVAADVVVPSTNGARIITANRRHHADLLWALRGAGNGNFGIVTSFTYTVHPLSKVAFLTAKWDGLEDLAAVFSAWQQQAPSTDRRLTSVLEVDPNAIQLFALLSSGTAREARAQLTPVLSAGKPAISVQASTWPNVFAGLNPGSRMFANWKFSSHFVTRPFPDEAIALVGRYMAAAPSPPSNFFCSSFGGAVRQSPPGGSAFPHRDALFYAEPGAGWNGTTLTPSALAWVAEFAQALGPYTNGAYVNVPNANMADWETAYWGSNVPRLRAVKARYDPHNVFRYEQSIPPPAAR